jgi:hypothetical protein
VEDRRAARVCPCVLECVFICNTVEKEAKIYSSIGSTAFVAENTVHRLLPRDVGECEGLSERGEGAVPGTRVPS